MGDSYSFADPKTLVCFCERITKAQIEAAIDAGASSVAGVSKATGACKSADRCEELNPKKHCCAMDIMEIIKIKKGEK